MSPSMQETEVKSLEDRAAEAGFRGDAEIMTRGDLLLDGRDLGKESIDPSNNMAIDDAVRGEAEDIAVFADVQRRIESETSKVEGENFRATSTTVNDSGISVEDLKAAASQEVDINGQRLTGTTKEAVRSKAEELAALKAQIGGLFKFGSKQTDREVEEDGQPLQPQPAILAQNQEVGLEQGLDQKQDQKVEQAVALGTIIPAGIMVGQAFAQGLVQDEEQAEAQDQRQEQREAIPVDQSLSQREAVELAMDQQQEVPLKERQPQPQLEVVDGLGVEDPQRYAEVQPDLQVVEEREDQLLAAGFGSAVLSNQPDLRMALMREHGAEVADDQIVALFGAEEEDLSVEREEDEAQGLQVA